MRSASLYSLSILAVLAGGRLSFAQTNAFTYQGRLNVDGAPANGTYDLAFSLFNTNVTGVAVAGPTTNSSTSISNGLFTTSIDFGSAAALKPYTWLEISVRTNGASDFVTLAPRQPLTPAPYALSAGSLADVVNNFNVILSNANATVSGGSNNQALATFSTVGGGVLNQASGIDSTIGGGSFNRAATNYSTVAGGAANQAKGWAATVAGGQGNAALNDYSAIGGGEGNTATGYGSTIPGGSGNQASGAYSFAAGWQAWAIHNYAFVWNDNAGGNYSSTADDQFRVHASGGIFLDGPVNANGGVTFATDMHLGVNSSDYRHFSIGGGNSYGYIYGSYPALGDGIHFGYNFYYDAAGTPHVINSGGATSRISANYGDIQLATGGVNAAPLVRFEVNGATVSVQNATFNGSSDRNLKQDFTNVNPQQVLDKVLALPVTEWSYKFDPTTRHIGPVAQDFYSAFNIGTDDKHIAPMDEGGLAFAAIKGLNQKLEERDATIQQLMERIEKLEKMMNHQ